MPATSATGGLPVSKILAILAVIGAAVTVAASDDMILRVAGISTAAIVLFATRVLPETVTAAATFLAFLGSPPRRPT